MAFSSERFSLLESPNFLSISLKPCTTIKIKNRATAANRIASKGLFLRSIDGDICIKLIRDNLITEKAC
jgi:hypothetical protein